MNERSKKLELSRVDHEACCLVKDLFPLYHEGLVGKDSEKIIQQHLETCKGCQSEYELYNDFENSLHGDNEDDEIIDYFKKIKMKLKIKPILFLIIGALLAGGLFTTLFVGIVPVNESQATIKYSAEKEFIDGDYNYGVIFDISIAEGDVLNSKSQYMGMEDGNPYQEIVLYNVLKLPFDDRGTTPNKSQFGFQKDRPFEENDQVVIRFRDGTITYSLKDIAENAGIQ
jgi:hypothetical protein